MTISSQLITSYTQYMEIREQKQKSEEIARKALIQHKKENGELTEDILSSIESGESNIKLPLFATSVSCGFVSPADDFIEAQLSLDEHLIPNPNSTFFVRASGDSMRETIQEGDLLVIDRSLHAVQGRIVLAVIDSEFTVKRYYEHGNEVVLRADNPVYPDIVLGLDRDFSIWGVVSHIIHQAI